MAGLLLIAAIRMAGALVISPALAAEPPLRVGVTPGTPPFVVQGAGGQLSGFTVELMRVVAADMRRASPLRWRPARP